MKLNLHAKITTGKKLQRMNVTVIKYITPAGI